MALIDHSQPLILGFSFRHAADKIEDLIAAYKKVGIPEEHIHRPSRGLVEAFEGDELGVDTKGTQEQINALSEMGYKFETRRTLGLMRN